MTDDLHAVLARLDAWLEANAPADHAWVPLATDITGGKLIIDHRGGDRFGNVLYGLHGGDTEGPVKVWDSLSHMFQDLFVSLPEGTAIRLPGYADPVRPHVSGTANHAFVRWE